MEFSDISAGVLKDIRESLRAADEPEISRLVDGLGSARRVFAAGAGRSLFVLSAFIQRIFQAGLDAHLPGAPNTPPAGEGDMVIACSASGRTRSALLVCEIAREKGCRIAAVTSGRSSPLAGMSDIVVCIPRIEPRPEAPRQPLGSLFEQCAFVMFDCVFLLLMEKLGISGEDLESRHANLE